jgi:hypothetical protein
MGMMEKCDILQQGLQYDIDDDHYIAITQLGSGWSVREMKSDGPMEPLRLKHVFHLMDKEHAVRKFIELVSQYDTPPYSIRELVGPEDELSPALLVI